KVTITDVDNAPNSATVTTTATIAAAKTTHKPHVVHGSARLTGTPSVCVLTPFTMRVKGRQIASVSWSLDGRRLTGKTARRGRQYSARISVKPGRHFVTVRV